MTFHQDQHETPVLFRRSRMKEPESMVAEVTAVFPAEPFDCAGTRITCYAHIGQHGACDSGWLARTRPATPAEYADLKAELEGTPYGYRLKVYKRRTRRHRAEFDSEVRRLNGRAI